MTGTSTPAIGASFQTQLGDGRTLVLQTHVDQSASAEELDALLDKFARAGERQRVYFNKVDQRDALAQLLEQQQRTLEKVTADLALLDKANTGRVLGKAEAAQRNNVVVTVERTKSDIENTMAKLAAMEQELKAK